MNIKEGACVHPLSHYWRVFIPFTTLQDVVSKVDVAQDKVHVGIVKYGDYPSVEFPLDKYTTRAEVGTYNIRYINLNKCWRSHFQRSIFSIISVCHLWTSYL